MSKQNIDRLLQASIVLLLGLFVFTIYSVMQDKVVNAGDSAPSFSVTASNGQTITPEKFGGKLLIVNFWATWCPPCIEETPSLIELHNRFASRGLVVLGISVDKNEKAYQNFLKRFSLPYLTFRDPEQVINTDYGTIKYPESYLIDQHGKVIQKIVGARDWTDEKMLNDVQSLL